MKYLRKGTGIILVVLVLLCAFTACNSKQSRPDGAGSDDTILQNDSQKAAAGMKIMPGLTEQQAQHFFVQPEQLGKMGEPVGAMDVQNGEAVADALIYTIRKATMFEDTEAAGIDTNAMSPSAMNEELLDDNGELKPGVKFMLIEVTVQNVRAEPEKNITDLNILCADTDSISDGNPEASFFELYPSVPAYFSNPTGKKVGDDWKEYFDYKLPVGQNKTLKVSWFVDTEQYDPENLYLTFCSDEYQKYIKIEF